MRRHLFAFGVAAFFVACSGSTASPGNSGSTQGLDTEGGGAPDSSSGTDSAIPEPVDASDGAATVDEAGLPCPGATITHPGTESRSAGTSIPFVGRARDASCTALTGTQLVWTDSVETAPLGTGETISHTFITKGPHTVTLTATDAKGNKSVATVTFTIT